MHADRLAISAELWEKIEPLIPGKAGDPGVTARNNRLFIEAVYRSGIMAHTHRVLMEGFARTDEEGFIDKVHVTPANIGKSPQFGTMIEGS